MDRIKSHASKIGSQNEGEVTTDTTIITVAKEGIRPQHPMLYQILEIMYDLSLDKLYKEISRRTVSERSVPTAFFIVMDVVSVTPETKLSLAGWTRVFKL